MLHVPGDRQRERDRQREDCGVAHPRYHRVSRLRGSPRGREHFGGKLGRALDPPVGVDPQARLSQKPPERKSPARHVRAQGHREILGSHLARLEMAVAYRHLVQRIQEIELAGPIERLSASLVGGVKKLPLRYQLKRAAA
jgi:hypothetical protein